MTVYTCERCREHVQAGDGYIHSETVGQWSIHHRECFDFTGSYCVAVPQHWTELLTAHQEFIQSKREPVGAGQ